MDKTKIDRHPDGRFKLGRPGGPGRPRKEREAAYQHAFGESFSPEDMASVVSAMVHQAQNGSVPAARLLLEYGIGKPNVQLEISPENEFRVAGCTPGELQHEAMRYALSKCEERLKYEQELYEEGYLDKPAKDYSDITEMIERCHKLSKTPSAKDSPAIDQR